MPKQQLEKRPLRKDCGEEAHWIMKVKVKLFATFKDLFGAEVKEIELDDGPNIEGLLNLLCGLGRCRQEIFDESGELRPYVKILKNGRHIQFLGGVHTELEDGDVITMFPPVGGG